MLRIEPSLMAAPEEERDVANDLMGVLEDALNSPLFGPFRESEPDGVASETPLPPFARPVVIVDGIHQLFRETATGTTRVEQSLRRLIDRCREQKAVFIFTVAENEPGMQRLDYLCDLVIQLDRTGFESPKSHTTRLLRLLKARRQPAITGTHILHLSGPKSFRVKPNVASHAEHSKALRWMDPDPYRKVQLADTWDTLRIRDRGQTLIYGKGSSGKAGLGLYMLHRRPFLYRDGDRDATSVATLFDAEIDDQILPTGYNDVTGAYEARLLVVSFLYQAPYYRNIRQRLKTRTRRTPRTAQRNLPDRALLDVIALYPGRLTPEDFLAKVDNQITAAELRGLPYTGVLIDGLHNVFIQYPALEADTAFWPQLYNTLRRRGISVVTTHTEFELRETGTQTKSLSVDFEHAQRRAAPLLSALVSAADNVFELSAVNTAANAWEYHLTARSILGEDPPGGYVTWNRQTCRLGDWRA
jgi:hypothetical protein